jgi:anti-sigma regulatory factor (Ser/Thr protein kinase)
VLLKANEAPKSSAAPHERVFPSTVSSVRFARQFVRGGTDGIFGDQLKLADIELATSELATNAIEHGDGDDFKVAVVARFDRLTVRVTSTGQATWPHLRDPTHDLLNGRGLRIGGCS